MSLGHLKLLEKHLVLPVLPKCCDSVALIAVLRALHRLYRLSPMRDNSAHALQHWQKPCFVVLLELLSTINASGLPSSDLWGIPVRVCINAIGAAQLGKRDSGFSAVSALPGSVGMARMAGLARFTPCPDCPSLLQLRRFGNPFWPLLGYKGSAGVLGSVWCFPSGPVPASQSRCLLGPGAQQLLCIPITSLLDARAGPGQQTPALFHGLTPVAVLLQDKKILGTKCAAVPGVHQCLHL